MKIYNDISIEYLISGFEKPTIEIGNYYLKWDDKSYGICHKEISELKGFIRDTIHWFDTSYELLNRLEKSNLKEKGNHKKNFPGLSFSYKLKDFEIGYDLFMKTDGTTLINRTEAIEFIHLEGDINSTDNDSQRKTYFKSALQIKWVLGELLFNRINSRITK